MGPRVGHALPDTSQEGECCGDKDCSPTSEQSVQLDYDHVNPGLCEHVKGNATYWVRQPATQHGAAELPGRSVSILTGDVEK